MQTDFGDVNARYEIYEDLKEVVMDKADLSQSNVLSNPARAFEFAPDEFESELQEPVSGGGTYDVVRLVPVKGGYAAGTVIYLYVDKTSSLPGKIVYNYDGETVNITIDKITPLNKVDKDIFTFDASKYKDYEVIDFR